MHSQEANVGLYCVCGWTQPYYTWETQVAVLMPHCAFENEGQGGH